MKMNTDKSSATILTKWSQGSGNRLKFLNKNAMVGRGKLFGIELEEKNLNMENAHQSYVL
jgi:hypothetical protein